MSSDPVRVIFHLDQNSPLAGVLRAAVQFQAAQAGFEPERCTEFAAASEAVCLGTLCQAADSQSGLDIALDSFADRMEISFLHRGQSAPAVGLETFASPDAFGAAGINGQELLTRVDRVLFNTENGKVRTTLVKYLKPHS
ncbi:MAG: hypothetical protein LAO19_13025 [Acidobacteriia bacterium]|nr:hypothetical protein [Terriglobia bacterium]